MRGIVDPYLKLSRAQKHLESLDSELTAFKTPDREPRAYTVERYDDLEQQRHVVRVKLNEVPDGMPLIVGDALYCMRSSLDQLVYSLASLTVSIPDQTTQFPIFDYVPIKARDINRWNRQVKGVPGEALTEIKTFQPYQRLAAVKAHPLWRLNALCNLDKHRRIPANGSELFVNFPNILRAVVRVENLDDCHIVSVPLTYKDKMQLDPGVAFTVNFGQGDNRNPDNFTISENPAGLWEIHNFIRDTVLPRFLRFFT